MFACIIAEQFRRLKEGDRFFYTNSRVPDSLNEFTICQLNEIRKVTMARIICDKDRDASSIQSDVFRLVDPFANPLMDCSAIPRINFTFWQAGFENSCLTGVGGSVGRFDEEVPFQEPDPTPQRPFPQVQLVEATNFYPIGQFFDIGGRSGHLDEFIAGGGSMHMAKSDNPPEKKRLKHYLSARITEEMPTVVDFQPLASFDNTSLVYSLDTSMEETVAEQ